VDVFSLAEEQRRREMRDLMEQKRKQAGVDKAVSTSFFKGPWPWTPFLTSFLLRGRGVAC